MSICRFHILCGHSRLLLSHSFISTRSIRHELSTSSLLVLRDTTGCVAPTMHEPARFSSTSAPKDEGEPPKKTRKKRTVKHKYPKPLLLPTTLATSGVPDTSNTQEDPPRKQKRQRKRKLTEEDVVRLAEDAHDSGSQSTLDDLARNILAERRLEIRANMLNQLLTVGPPLPSYDVLASLFSSISKLRDLRIHFESLGRLTVALLRSDDRSPKIIELLAKNYAARFRELRNQPEEGMRPEAVRASFRFVSYLARSPDKVRQTHALAIFQNLVETQYVPSEALQDADVPGHSFATIVTISLVRSCLHWNWRADAALLVKLFLRDVDDLPPAIIQLCTDVCKSLLEIPSSDELSFCLSLITQLGEHRTPHFLSDDLIYNFYNVALETEQADTAQRLFAWAVSPHIVSHHEHPVPRSYVAPWLLDHILNNSKQIDLGRTLVRLINGAHATLSQSARAPTIQLAAQFGFAVDARVLWKRYYSGKQRALVVANAGVAGKMTSLFTSLLKMEVARGRQLKDKFKRLMEDAQPDENVVFDSDSVLESEMESELAGGLGSALSAMSDDSLPSSSDPSPMPPNTLEDEEPQSGPAEVPKRILALRAEKEAVYARIADYIQFTRGIVDRFQESKLPLHEASHSDLNALARMHFRVGNIYEGFSVFHVLLNRKEIPDVQDVTVAMTVMAEHDHRHAARMLRTMASKGLVPNGPIIGTVIHHALLKQDIRVVRSVLVFARELGVQLTLKTMDTLIRGSITLSLRDRDALKENLRRALTIVEANIHEATLPTLALGKFCIVESLVAEEPELAFRYWQLLVKGRTEWNDLEHMAIRGRIGRRIEYRTVKGVLSWEEGKAILRELGMTTGVPAKFDVSDDGSHAE